MGAGALSTHLWSLVVTRARAFFGFSAWGNLASWQPAQMKSRAWEKWKDEDEITQREEEKKLAWSPARALIFQGG